MFYLLLITIFVREFKNLTKETVFKAKYNTAKRHLRPNLQSLNRGSRTCNDTPIILTNDMNYFAIEFENKETKEKDFREYPQMSQFANRQLLAEFLHKREFLKSEDGWYVKKIVSYDLDKIKQSIADSWGKLIYS